MAKGKIKNISVAPDPQWKKIHCYYNNENEYLDDLIWTHSGMFVCGNCKKEPWIQLTSEQVEGKKSIICPLCKSENKI